MYIYIQSVSDDKYMKPMRHLILMLIALPGFGQVGGLSDMEGGNAGTAALSYLKLPVGAKSFAMGGNAASLLDDATSVTLNPANLASLNAYELTLSHHELYAGIRHEYAGLVFPTLDWGNFGFQWNMLNSGAIPYARDISEKAVSPTTSDMAMGLAYARGLFANRVLVGGQAQYVQSRLDKTTARSFSADAAASLRLPWGLRISGVIKNMSPGISYSQGMEPLPLGVIGDLAAVLPGNRAEITAGVKKFTDSPVRVSAGAQADVVPALCLRAGYEITLPDNEETGALRGLSAGTGLKYGAFGMEYSFVNRGGLLGALHVFNITFRAKSLKPLTAEDHLKTAVRHFREREYKKCIASAGKALEMAPNLWQAHVLIEEAMRCLRVAEKSILALAYTGNTSGIFMPTTDHSLGGLPRRAGALKNLRGDYPLIITVDAGNYLSVRTDSLKRRVGYGLLKRLKYDAINLGVAETGLDVPEVASLASEAGLHMVSVNSRIKPATIPFIEQKLFNVGNKYNVTVIGALPEVKPRIESKAWAEPPLPLLRDAVADARTRSDVVVVLSGAGLSECLVWAGELKEADVIVCGASDEVTFAPILRGKTLVVSAGSYGENLGLLTLRFNPSKKIIGYSNKIIALDVTIPEDAVIRRMLENMVVSPDDESEPEGHPSPYILPFVANYDVCAYHGPKLDTLKLDSLALASIGIDVIRDSINLDSLKRAIIKNDSARLASILKQNNYWGVAQPGDTAAQIYLHFLAQNTVKRVTWNRHDCSEPLLSPGGSAVLFFMDSLTQEGIRAREPGARVASVLMAYDITGGLSYPFPAEQGRTIVKAAWGADNSSVYTVERDKDNGQELFLRRLGRNMTVNVSRSPGASEREVAVSPAGNSLAYSSADKDGVQLFLTGLSGENPIRLTFARGYCANPAFSESGRMLAYTFNARSPDKGGDLCVAYLKKDRLDTLTTNLNVTEIAWNGDTEILLVSGVNYTDINVINVKTRAMRKLVNRAPGENVSERHPRVFNMGEGVMVCYEVVTSEGSYIALCDMETGTETVLFNGDGRFRLK